MGKASREKNRELAQQAEMATDLNALRTRPLMMKGLQCDTVQIVTQYGPTIAVQLTFHMQDGKQHGPIVLDILNSMIVLSAITGVFASSAQGPAVPEPLAPTEATDPTQGPETETPSGLIIPG